MITFILGRFRLKRLLRNKSDKLPLTKLGLQTKMRFSIQEDRINVALMIVLVAIRMSEVVMEEEDEVTSTTKVDMNTLSINVLLSTKMVTT